MCFELAEIRRSNQGLLSGLAPGMAPVEVLGELVLGAVNGGFHHSSSA
jgi:hypothetical protein